jgi:hypothetical protein
LVGSQLLNSSTDDWEPAVATDPSAPYVYLLTTRYGVPPPGCSSHCPSPFIALARSSDGGSTFGAQVPLCLCLGSKAQYDPTIEVVPDTGAVYSVFLNGDRHNGFSTVFTKSTDHGRTWSEPVHVYGNVSWTDKPEVATSASGKDVYVSWNGPQGGDLYVGQSHDYGATWTQQKLSDSKRYYYAYDARVLSGGRSCSRRAASSTRARPTSRARCGTTQSSHATAERRGRTSSSRGCRSARLASRTDASRTSTSARRRWSPLRRVSSCSHTKAQAPRAGPQQVYVSSSSDEGRTWGAGVPVSVAGEDATQPRLASFGGSTRLWYMQTAGGDNPDAWNVWYRSSADGGATWSAPVKISDAPAGAAAYVGADGFSEIYGDYGEIGVTSTGKTFAAWGEGFSYTGPGGTWFNVQR